MLTAAVQVITGLVERERPSEQALVFHIFQESKGKREVDGKWKDTLEEGRRLSLSRVPHALRLFCCLLPIFLACWYSFWAICNCSFAKNGREVPNGVIYLRILLTFSSTIVIHTVWRVPLITTSRPWKSRLEWSKHVKQSPAKNHRVVYVDILHYKHTGIANSWYENKTLVKLLERGFLNQYDAIPNLPKFSPLGAIFYLFKNQTIKSK